MVPSTEFDTGSRRLLGQGMSANRPRMRKDAEANRERIILAGKRIMQDLGGDVPVEVICENAGITRGTFYRNFADRSSLYEAVLEFELDTMIEALKAPSDDPLTFLRLFAEMMMVYDKFLSILPDMEDYRTDGVSEAKIVAAITPSLRKAQAEGAVTADLTGEDVMLICRMMAADWRLDRVATRAEALDRRMTLIKWGIAPRHADHQS